MKICILGSGSYALALANMFNYNKDNDIILWSKFEEEINYIKKNGMIKNLPNIKLPSNLKYTTNMKDALNNTSLIVIAVPSTAFREVAINLSKYYKKNMHICIATKGIEQETSFLMSEILNLYIKSSKLAVISGGTFAIDMFDNPLIGLTLSSKNKQTINLIKNTLNSKHLHLNISNDVIGVELCGAVKNIFAIIMGMLDGLNLNTSTRYMFITDIINELGNIIYLFSKNKNTILTYAGCGDLLLTCNSTKSRNYNLGYLIATKKNKDEISKYLENNTTEGYYTLKSFYNLLKNKNISIPIINIIYDIIYNDMDIDNLINYLYK